MLFYAIGESQMTDKDLKRLSRKDLLEMLVEYGEQVEKLSRKLASANAMIDEQKQLLDEYSEMEAELSASNARADALQEKLSTAEEKLRNREIVISDSGSIAEAALRINAVFEAAQQAADQYLENVKRQQPQADASCQDIEAAARARADQMIREAELHCEEMERRSKSETDRYWQETSGKLRELIDSNSYLQAMLQHIKKG